MTRLWTSEAPRIAPPVPTLIEATRALRALRLDSSTRPGAEPGRASPRGLRTSAVTHQCRVTPAAAGTAAAPRRLRRPGGRRRRSRAVTVTHCGTVRDARTRRADGALASNSTGPRERLRPASIDQVRGPARRRPVAPRRRRELGRADGRQRPRDRRTAGPAEPARRQGRSGAALDEPASRRPVLAAARKVEGKRTERRRRALPDRSCRQRSTDRVDRRCTLGGESRVRRSRERPPRRRACSAARRPVDDSARL